MSESQSHFLATVIVTDSELQALDQFITEPDTRRGDIFRGETLPISDAYYLDWLIKHDLFEGVVVQVSLMDNETHSFLAGTGRSLSQSQDILDDFIFTWEDKPVILRVETPPA